MSAVDEARARLRGLRHGDIGAFNAGMTDLIAAVRAEERYGTYHGTMSEEVANELAALSPEAVRIIEAAVRAECVSEALADIDTAMAHLRNARAALGEQQPLAQMLAEDADEAARIGKVSPRISRKVLNGAIGKAIREAKPRQHKKKRR